MQMTLCLEQTLTDRQILQRVPDDWGRPDWPAFDPVLMTHHAFGLRLHLLCRRGLVEFRVVTHAVHGLTGEERTWYSTDADCPSDFNTGGLSYSSKRPWYSTGTHGEWRKAARGGA